MMRRFIVILNGSPPQEVGGGVKHKVSAWLKGDPTVPLVINGDLVEIRIVDGVGFYCASCNSMQDGVSVCENCGAPVYVGGYVHD